MFRYINIVYFLPLSKRLLRRGATPVSTGLTLAFGLSLIGRLALGGVTKVMISSLVGRVTLGGLHREKERKDNFFTSHTKKTNLQIKLPLNHTIYFVISFLSC